MLVLHLNKKWEVKKAEKSDNAIHIAANLPKTRSELKYSSKVTALGLPNAF
jgi:hypothetical protein